MGINEGTVTKVRKGAVEMCYGNRSYRKQINIFQVALALLCLATTTSCSIRKLIHIFYSVLFFCKRFVTKGFDELIVRKRCVKECLNRFQMAPWKCNFWNEKFDNETSKKAERFSLSSAKDGLLPRKPKLMSMPSKFHFLNIGAIDLTSLSLFREDAKVDLT